MRLFITHLFRAKYILEGPCTVRQRIPPKVCGEVAKYTEKACSPWGLEHLEPQFGRNHLLLLRLYLPLSDLPLVYVSLTRQLTLVNRRGTDIPHADGVPYRLTPART